jgi:hypothetical protein
MYLLVGTNHSLITEGSDEWVDSYGELIDHKQGVTR